MFREQFLLKEQRSVRSFQSQRTGSLEHGTPKGVQTVELLENYKHHSSGVKTRLDPKFKASSNPTYGTSAGRWCLTLRLNPRPCMAPANCGLVKPGDSVVATAQVSRVRLNKHRPEDMHVYEPD